MKNLIKQLNEAIGLTHKFYAYKHAEKGLLTLPSDVKIIEFGSDEDIDIRKKVFGYIEAWTKKDGKLINLGEVAPARFPLSEVASRDSYIELEDADAIAELVEFAVGEINNNPLHPSKYTDENNADVSEIAKGTKKIVAVYDTKNDGTPVYLAIVPPTGTGFSVGNYFYEGKYNILTPVFTPNSDEAGAMPFGILTFDQPMSPIVKKEAQEYCESISVADFENLDKQ